jgi:uncharacterized protein (DUF885 family)
MTDVLARTPVNDLADRYWQGFLERLPVYATFVGDDRYDDRLGDPGPEGRAAEVHALEELLAGAAAIDRQSLGVEDTITLDMLEVVARINLTAYEQQQYQLDTVSQLSGPQTLPNDLARFQRTDTPERVESLARRLEGYPAYIEAHVQNLQDSIASGRTSARPVIERTTDQVRRLTQAPLDEAPLLTRQDLTDGGRARLRDAMEHAVLPGYQRYLEALEQYAAHARPGDGLWSIPDGAAAYRNAVLASTTLEADPQELHDYGLAQIESIDRERTEIARSLGHADVAAFRAALNADPSNVAKDSAELVRRAEAQVQEVVAAAPRYFGRLPRAKCEVRAVESYMEREAPPAFYYPPAPDGSRGGIYFINTFQPEDRPLHRLASTTYHEATPGHHFQLTIETELQGLPAFRTLGSRLVGVAFPEGWGLYSERLADEMGMYEDERERFGMLDAQAWRAARLVVDTGMHAFRWDRQRSVDFLRDRVGLTQLESDTETDRYISWPGQALAYMSGQREIEGLRRQLERRDGDRFDLKGFHDAVLGHGSLPLATLRRELPQWVRPAR